jgi:hypothetical protein
MLPQMVCLATTCTSLHLDTNTIVYFAEAADLGAFTSVFQVLREQQPIRALYPMWQANAISSSFTESSMTRSYSEATSSDNQVSDAPEQTTTVWTQRPIATYLNSTSSMTYSTEQYSEEFTVGSTEDEDTHNDTQDDTEDQEEEEEEEEEVDPAIDGVEDDNSSSPIHDEDQPSLGYLGEVLNYLAAERERFAAEREREARTRALTGAWKHVVEPRRKRRKKKSGSNSSKGRSLSAVRILQRKQGSMADSDILQDTAPPIDNTSAEDDSYSSSIEVSSTSNDAFRSVPATPPRNEAITRSLKLKLMHSRSNPDLRPTVPGEPFDPHVIGLRKLAHKLRMLFPADAGRLAKIPTIRHIAGEDWVDPRGPTPQAHDTLTHVFIDHSNILIGFLTFLRRNRHLAKRYKHMSHDALALVLERGRPITRRVLVTSSPLYQPMESAERLEYEVRVYARVPDTGDGADRRHNQSTNDVHAAYHHHHHQSHRHRRGKSGGDIGSTQDGAGSVAPATSSKGRKGRRRASLSMATTTTTTSNTSNTSTSTESEKSTAISISSSSLARSSLLRPSLIQTTAMVGSAPAVTQLATTSSMTAASATTSTTRVRYREQGVDELLQLKLHQAIADVDPPPPGATIVLATGDGNVGQFNDDGFLGPVRTALKKGWRVELYAWEEGLSRAWKREFGDGPWKDRFVVIGMEQFGADLVEVPVANP